MVCIWKGDMTAILDLMKFSAILCNSHEWALREQRPRISGFIDLWKIRHQMGSRSTAKQEEPETLPEPKTITTIGTGPKPSPPENMEPRDWDRLLDLLGVYEGILKDERRERQTLMARVDEMQQMLKDFIERRGSGNLSSPPSQPVQQTGSQQSFLDEKSAATKSTPTPPQSQFITVPDFPSKPNRRILPLRKKPLATAKQKTKPPPVSSVRPEIFGEGILVRWASNPGRRIRIRLPKPPPTTSKTTMDRTPIFRLPMLALMQTPAQDMAFSVFGGQLPAPTKPATPSKPAAPIKPSGTGPTQGKREEAILQPPLMTSIFSNIQSASGGAGLFQAGPSTTSIFSIGGLKPTVSQDLPKFDFAAPLPKAKQPAFNFDLTPFPTSKDKTPGSTSSLFSGPPKEKDEAPASTSTFFSGPFMAKDNTHGVTASALFSSPSTAKEKENKTADSSSAPFATSSKSEEGRRPTSPTPQTATVTAPEGVAAHTPKPGPKPTTSQPPQTGSTPEAKANRYGTPEPIQQPSSDDDDDDGKYDAGDEDDEEWETEASD